MKRKKRKTWQFWSMQIVLECCNARSTVWLRFFKSFKPNLKTCCWVIVDHFKVRPLGQTHQVFQSLITKCSLYVCITIKIPVQSCLTNQTWQTIYKIHIRHTADKGGHICSPSSTVQFTLYTLEETRLLWIQQQKKYIISVFVTRCLNHWFSSPSKQMEIKSTGWASTSNLS